MANPKHVAILKQGVTVWNKWREDNPEVEPDLAKIDINSEEFRANQEIRVYTNIAEYADINLKDANLEKAVFSGANLIGACFDNAQLYMATFNDAEMAEASFKGAELKNARLPGCGLFQANFQDAYLANADLSSTTSQEANFSKARFFKADFSDSDLAGAQFEEAIGSRCNFSKASLMGALFKAGRFVEARFEKSSLDRADFSGANLVDSDFGGAAATGVNLSGADIRNASFNECDVTNIIYDKKTKCQGVRVATCYGSQMFKTFAQDQDFLEEFQEKHKWAYRIWWLFADCGRSFARWAGWSFLFALLFAAIFSFALGPESFHINGDLPPTFMTMTYYSVVTFTTLGFGDLTPATTTAAVFVMCEVVLGYIMLGGLISILANKLARRA